MLLPVYACRAFYCWAYADSDPRLEILRSFRWVATFNQGTHGYTYRSYFYVRRHYTEAGKKKREYLHQAVIRLLGETVPPGSIISFKDKLRLNCSRENLLIGPEPAGGYSIPPGRRLAKYYKLKRAQLAQS